MTHKMSQLNKDNPYIVTDAKTIQIEIYMVSSSALFRTILQYCTWISTNLLHL